MSNRKFSRKNKLTLLALSLITPVAMAGTMGEISTSSFEGWYGGIMGGILETKSHILSTSSSNSSNINEPGNILSITQSDVNVNKFTGTDAIYLGYGRFFHNNAFLMAFEIAGNMGKRKNTLNNLAALQEPNGTASTASLATSTTAKLKSGEFDFDLRPGFLIDTQTMLYGRVGGALNQLTLTSDNTFVFNQLAAFGFITAADYTSPLKQQTSRKVVGLRIGAGIERALRQRFSITADYIYTYYGTMNASNIGNSTSTTVATNSAFTNVNGLSGNSSARIFTQMAMLGVKYYFPV